MCYIHELSPIKKARSGKTEYYNFTVQSKDSYHHGVSFRMDLREEFEQSASQKSPVKLKNIKRKANWKDNTKQDIEVNRTTKLEIAKSANFPFKKVKKDIAQITKIKLIQEEGYDRQVVSLVGYINVEKKAVLSMDQSSKRTDIFINDDTGVMMISVWNEKFDQIPKSGVYEVQNAVVRNFSDLMLTTTSETDFIPSALKISKSAPPYPLTTQMKFPVSNVSISCKTLKCPRCYSTIEQDNKLQGSDFFHCTKCKSSAKFSSLIAQIMATIQTKDGQEVKMYYPQLVQYLQNKGQVSLEDEQKVCEIILLDELTDFQVNHQNVVVDF